VKLNSSLFCPIFAIIFLVPILDRFNIAIPYDGQIMAPLSSEFSFFGDVAVKAPEVARAVVDAVSDIA